MFIIVLVATSEPRLNTTLGDGNRKGFAVKKSAFILIVCLAWSAGCATKIHYYHPDKTSTEIEMDYTQCMNDIDARVDRRNPVSKLLEECMESRGYELLSERKAEQLGITTRGIWPPYASTTSSVGP
jgi:hypothetical protein